MLDCRPTAAVTWRPWRPGRPITASYTAGVIASDTPIFTHTAGLDKTSRHAFTASHAAIESEEPLVCEMLNLLTMCCSCWYWLPVQAGWPNLPINTHTYWHWHNVHLVGRAQEDNNILTNQRTHLIHIWIIYHHLSFALSLCNNYLMLLKHYIKIIY